MMIVTHEMSFARAICNRVFYMDQGGIHEDGTPDQIFDHPQRERTRQFIQKLKVLEIRIDSYHKDYLSINSEIDQYCQKSMIPSRMGYRIHLIFEELVQNILLPELPEPEILITVEYSQEKDLTEMTALYNGRHFDPADSNNELSYTLLKNIAQEIIYSAHEEGKFTNSIRFIVTE
jgi:polar amino acid transport system ATP-binding protein